MKKQILIAGILLLIFTPKTFAAANPCDAIKGDLTPDCADSVSKCESVPGKKYSAENPTLVEKTPPNCIFLEEPIGGEIGVDLFKVNCNVSTKDLKDPKKNISFCTYRLWRGEAIKSTEKGPIQALLSYDASKPYQGSFGLLYSYVSVIYKYLSGLIVGIVVLMIVVGGIEMSISGGDSEKVTHGKDRITKAIIGMVIWFLASLILYTINPTFFTF
jgi:hypothetical protein